ncbi:MAG: TraR/DksA family transcriptional regulator [Streptosporangiales bacterium]
MPDDLERVLADKRAELEAEMDALTAPVADQGSISFGKRVGEGTNIAVERLSQVAAHDRLQETLTQVRRAQDRLAAGSYGTCEECEAPIPAERLEARPWALVCMTCAARTR